MAVEMEIPKDIRKYEAKLVGPFTTRQTVCMIPAAILAAGAYIGLGTILPSDICMFISLTIATPFILCGWIKPYGMPFEKFAKMVMISIVLAPKNRKYITENVYKDVNTKNNDDESENKENKKNKKNNTKNKKTKSGKMKKIR